jgi:hypothetical protein
VVAARHPVYEQLALSWIDCCCGREIDHRPQRSESIQWAHEALARLRSQNRRLLTRTASGGCS